MSTVFVVGSLNIDQRIQVPSLPRPGETICGSEATFNPGGKGGNQAVAAARAGASVVAVGAVGNDVHGTSVLKLLTETGVSVENVQTVNSLPTGTAIITVDEHGENQIIVSPGANSSVTSAHIETGLSRLGSGDVLVLQLEIPADLVRHAARIAKNRGASVILNAAPSPHQIGGLFDDVDLLIVNEHEIADLAALKGLKDGVPQLVRILPEVLGPQVLCTVGPLGSFTHAEGKLLNVPAPTVSPVDTTAAGDTFVGYLAASIVDGASLREAMETASQASAITVTRPGAMESIPWAHECRPSTHFQS